MHYIIMNLKTCQKLHKNVKQQPLFLLFCFWCILKTSIQCLWGVRDYCQVWCTNNPQLNMCQYVQISLIDSSFYTRNCEQSNTGLWSSKPKSMAYISHHLDLAKQHTLQDAELQMVQRCDGGMAKILLVVIQGKSLLHLKTSKGWLLHRPTVHGPTTHGPRGAL